jgi:hypothetical protein
MWPFRKKSTPATDEPEIYFDPYRGDPRARELRQAAEAQDWAAVRRIFDGPLSDRDYAFHVDLVAGAPGAREWIEGVRRDHPDETLPLLVQGADFIDWAWELRGSGYADTVAPESWPTIRKRLAMAENCFDEALARDPKCTEALYRLIGLAKTRQRGQAEVRQRFEALIAVAPMHANGHSSMLDALAPKWGGSTEAMLAFARERAAEGPGTTLPALIAEAHLEEFLRRSPDGTEYMEQPEVGDELVHAAEQSIWHPQFAPAGGSVMLLNRFAYAFSLADRFAEAERCFERIGDRLVTRYPWHYGGRPGTVFLEMRAYVRGQLED